MTERITTREEALRLIKDTRIIVLSRKTRSAWDRGVNYYAETLLNVLEDDVNGGWVEPSDLQSAELVRKAMLNGASDWHHFSWSGNALIYDGDIAGVLCNATELKRTAGGKRRPNKQEDWMDVQGRALFQAFLQIRTAMDKAR